MAKLPDTTLHFSHSRACMLSLSVCLCLSLSLSVFHICTAAFFLCLQINYLSLTLLISASGTSFLEYIILRIQPARCNFSQFIYFCKMLYMFQTVFPSIIRSFKLHTQCQAFVKPLLLPAASLDEMSETCRASYRNK